MHAYRRRPRVGGRAGGDAAQAAADPKRVTQAACRLRSLLQPRPASPDAPLPSAQSKTATESEFQMERGAPARRAPARAWRRRPCCSWTTRRRWRPSRPACRPGAPWTRSPRCMRALTSGEVRVGCARLSGARSSVVLRRRAGQTRGRAAAAAARPGRRVAALLSGWEVVAIGTDVQGV